MATIGQIVSVNGLVLSPEPGGISYSGTLLNTSDNTAQTAETRGRGDDGLTWVRGQFAGRTLRARFRPGTATDRARILAAIDPGSGPWMMQAGVFAGITDVITGEVEVATTSIHHWQGNILVELSQLDAVWRAVTPATATKTTTSLDGTLALTVGGHARIRPTITLNPSVIRSAFTTVKGWRYRKQITLTNNGTETLDRFPYRISLGDTAALVTAGKLQADGDDLRVWFEGEDLPRELVAINTTVTYLWIVLDGLAAGESRTYDIVYGNASATNPPVPVNTETARNKTIFDIGASTNTLWLYNVNPLAANAGDGLWWINRGTKTPGRVAFDAPGSWRRFLMLENGDDYNQQRSSGYTVTSVNYWQATLDAERYRKDATKLQDEGQADGIWIHVPTSVTSLEASFRYINIAENSDQLLATGKAVIMVREGGGEAWETVYERSDVQATEIFIANTIYSFGTPKPKEVYVGALPRDGIEIPQNARGISRIQFRTNQTFRLNVDTTSIAAGALGAEVAIWDTYGRLEMSTTGSSDVYRMELGGYGSSGRLAIPLTNDLVIDAEERTIGEWTGSTLVARREFAGVAIKVETVNGVTTGIPSHEWLLAKPSSATLTHTDLGTGVALTATFTARYFG